MSLTTSYRFETNTDRKELQRALLKQKERIKQDELMAARTAVVKNELNINKNAGWAENLEVASKHRRMKEETSIMKQEAVLAKNALVEVRRAALRNQLEKEYQQYEAELHGQAKAFYFKRE